MSNEKSVMQLLKDHPNADLVLYLAIRWRREQLEKDKVGEESCARAMGLAMDEMVHDIAGKAMRRKNEQ